MDEGERDRTITALQDHYAKNRLEIEDFERRVELAERATTGRELARSIDGLPVIAEVVAPSAPVTLNAVLGSVTRRGRFTLPQQLTVTATLGNVDLDLTEAELARGLTTLVAVARFGSITITVPDDIDVESNGRALLGSVEHMGQRARSKKDPRRLRIEGNALCGSVEIVVRPKPPVGLLEGLAKGVRGLLGS
jgi:hypothetical protein